MNYNVMLIEQLPSGLKPGFLVQKSNSLTSSHREVFIHGLNHTGTPSYRLYRYVGPQGKARKKCRPFVPDK